jgi:signal peptidase I
MNMFSRQNHEENSELILSEEDLNQNLPKEENGIIEVIRFSIIALLIVIPVRMFIAQPFIVSGASMAETFHTGEYLIVDQVSYYLHDPSRGDVVIFRYPKDPTKYFIKRVIGLPGDTVIVEDSKVMIKNATNPEGFFLEEPYVRSMRTPERIEQVLGDREYFVMGDNRDESSDSRIWGVLQKERIVGRAFLRLFPPTELDILPGATTEGEMKVIN